LRPTQSLNSGHVTVPVSLDQTFGRSKNSETLVYTGPSDLRYPIFV